MLRNINLQVRASSGQIILYATLLKLVDTMLQLTAVRYDTGKDISNYETWRRGIESFTTGARFGKLSFISIRGF